ncbi:MAG: TPM domain-containing protein [Bacillaceae bacterium]
MRKHLFSFFSIILVLLSFSFPVNATGNKVYDQANLFSTSEIQQLENTIASITQTYNMDVGVVTTNNVDGKSSRDYADDFYDYNGFGVGPDFDGLLLLINMEDREVYISTSGVAIDYFTDARIDNMLDNVYKDLGDGKYFVASSTFLNDVQDYIQAGIPDGQHRIEELTTKDIITRIIISIVVGLAIAMLVCFIIYRRYKNPKAFVAENYLDRNSLQITAQKDEFIRTYTTKTKIEKPKDNGGSTTHTSSSGRSHGGGGRGF